MPTPTARAKSVEDDSPTRPGKSADGSDPGATSDHVLALVPLDAVPVLAVGPEKIQWDKLGPLATQLLRRVNGEARAMSIVIGTSATPADATQMLANLARRGLIRLTLPEARS